MEYLKKLPKRKLIRYWLFWAVFLVAVALVEISVNYILFSMAKPWLLVFNLILFSGLLSLGTLFVPELGDFLEAQFEKNKE